MYTYFTLSQKAGKLNTKFLTYLQWQFKNSENTYYARFYFILKHFNL